MSAPDVLMPEDGMQGGWANSYLTPSPSLTNYGYNSPIISTTGRKLVRPRSVPTRLARDNGTGFSVNPQSTRPKTAIGYNPVECDRVHQVEYESTRKHNLDAHLPVKKKKPPPWQAKLDPPPVPCLVTPGYILAKSKSKVAMYIKTEDFFEPPPQEEPVKPDPERDSLISQLQQQIDDLSLFLEEERINHKETKRKAADMLRDKIEEMTNQHANDIRMILDQHREEVESVSERHSDQMRRHNEKTQAVTHKMQGEIEFLQGAFDSYKTQLHIETTDKWKKKEDDLRLKQEALIQEKIHELRQKMIAEKNRENADAAKEHSREIHELRKLQRKEMDNLVKRFSNAAADIEKLKETQIELQETQNSLKDLQTEYSSMSVQLNEATRELSDTKIRLFSFEESFSLKVQLIDDKYKHQMDELMAQNADLKRLYVKKCGELYDEKTEGDIVRKEQVETAKETMKLFYGTDPEDIEEELWEVIGHSLRAHQRPLSVPKSPVQGSVSSLHNNKHQKQGPGEPGCPGPLPGRPDETP